MKSNAQEHFSKVDSLTTLAYDAWRFAQQFASLLEDHPLLVYDSALPFSPPQTRLYQHFIPNPTHGVTRTTKTWSPLLLRIPAHEKDDVRYVGISPDGSSIISADSGRELRIWDAITGTNRGDIQGTGLSRPVFCDKGTKIAAIRGGKEIVFWGSDTLRELSSIKIPDDKVFQCFAISADGKRVLAGSWASEGATKVREGHDGAIYLWEIENLTECTLRIEEKQAGVSAVCFSPDGSHFLSGTQRGDVRLWDKVGKEVLSNDGKPFHSEPRAVNQLAWSLDGKRFTASSAVSVRVWDAKTKEQLWNKPISIALTSLCFSPNNEWIACVGNLGKRLDILDAGSGNKVFQNPPQAPIQFAAFSQDSTKLILAKCGDGRPGRDVEVWDVDLVRTRPAATGVQPSNRTVAISPDGRLAAFQGDDTESSHWVRVVDTQTGQNVCESWREPLRAGVSHFVFSGDSSHLGTWGVGSKAVRLFNLKIHQELEPLSNEYQDHPKMIGFSRDGSKLVLATKYDNEVFDLSSTPRESIYHTGDPSSIYSYATLSPDGTRTVYTGQGKALIVEVATSKEHELESYTNRANPAFIFSPDGTLVMAAPQVECQSIEVWHTSDGRRAYDALPTWTDDMEMSKRPPTVFYSDDGTTIIARGATKVAAWEALTGRPKPVDDLREYTVEAGWVCTGFRCPAGEKRRITKLPEDGNWTLVAQRQNMLVFVSTPENELIFLHLQDSHT